MLIMRPPLGMWGNAAWMRRNGPRTLAWNILSQDSVSMAAISGCPNAMPALLMTISMVLVLRPSRAARTRSVPKDSDDASALAAMAWTPSSLI
jgi:hypothetical protein